MFNRTSFDRTLYDRNAALDGVQATLRGLGKLTSNILVRTYLDSVTLKGIGRLDTTMKLNLKLPMVLTGSSELNTGLRLRLPLTIGLNGSGTITPKVGLKVPIPDLEFEGSSEMNVDERLYLTQKIDGALIGSGLLGMPLTLRAYLESAMNGDSDMSVDDKFRLAVYCDSDMSGSGWITLRRIGALNTETLELEGINLQPGQTLIIDTDELNIFMDDQLDVDSVTSDSVFFQLQPGDNDISMETDLENPQLNVSVVWQNRWL